jgi:hypothetical protein
VKREGRLQVVSKHLILTPHLHFNLTLCKSSAHFRTLTPWLLKLFNFGRHLSPERDLNPDTAMRAASTRWNATLAFSMTRVPNTLDSSCISTGPACTYPHVDGHRTINNAGIDCTGRRFLRSLLLQPARKNQMTTGLPLPPPLLSSPLLPRSKSTQYDGVN